MNISEIDSYISKIPDYPKPGILFYDISTLISNSLVFKAVIDKMSNIVNKFDFDKVAAIDARGFIFGAALAQNLGVGLIMIRKKNKLPGNLISYEYKLEYGKDCLEINSSLCKHNFALIDDVLATGGTANAACELIKKGGGYVNCFCTLIELEFLSGKSNIDVPFESIIKY